VTGAAIGSINFLPAQGRLGVVVGAQSVGPPDNGRQLVALKIKTIGAPACADCAADTPLAADPHGLAGSRGDSSGSTGVQGAAQGISESARSARIQPGILERAPSGPGAGPRPGARSYQQLEPEERAVVDRLRQRDAQVKQEEKAHAAVAGDLAGPISYIYQRGPDGQLYAVGGSVPIQAQTVSGDPDEAARIGARLAAAGQAATNPSGADLAAVRAGYRLQGSAEQDLRRSGPAERALDITV
jgi:hypothetical protein